jgi:hypothetical protein
MPSYVVQLRFIQKKLPRGFALPASFRAFCKQLSGMTRGDCGWFAVKSGTSDDLPRAAGKTEFVTFMTLPDGGTVHFWFHVPRRPAIVWSGHDGDWAVVAVDWPDFLIRFQVGKTGIPDVDDRQRNNFPRLVPARRVASLTTMNDKLAARILKSAGPVGPGRRKVSSVVARALWKALRDRQLLKSRNDRATLLVTLSPRSYRVDWYNFGLRPFPDAGTLRPIFEQWWNALGRNLKKSEFSVYGDGSVFFEKNTPL